MTPQDLKNSILQFAIQGKIVAQKESDGDSRVLLECVLNANKAKIKGIKQKTISAIDESNCPFEIPSNWHWVRLGSVCLIARGGSPRPIQDYLTDDPDGINWIKISDTDKNGKYITSTKEKIKKSGLSKTRMVHKGDFLLTNSMSFGRPYILQTDGCIHDGWLVISQPTEVFDKDFLYYLLSSAFAYSQFCGKVSGAVVKNLNSDKVADSLFPLPPLAEQKRIVEKIETLIPLVDEYERIWNKLEALNKNISVALEKSILQVAFTGKLVPQVTEEGTGNETFQEIKNGKKHLCSKNRKIPSEIKETEIPFEIPPTWRWCRLNDIVYNRGQQIPTSRFSYIDIGSIDNKRKKLNDIENVLEAQNAPSRARKVVGYGDILYSTVRPYLHNICVVDRNFSYPPIASTGFAVLTPCPGLLNEYLFYYLCSPGFDAYVNASDNSKGVAYPAINDDRLYRALVPLPPLDEQKRIVDKIKSLMSLIKQMEFDKEEA